MLGLCNRDVAEQFVNGRWQDRFAVGEWGEMHGVPVLESAQSSFVCRRAHCHEFGTHTIFIGELIDARHRADAAPLTYYDRHYIDISEAPESCTALSAPHSNGVSRNASRCAGRLGPEWPARCSAISCSISCARASGEG